ncbi:MAG: ATP-binding protein involved in chromosome partitioning [Bacteroidia bacterium]|jgi:ATP-binding protein involved in chromosome partitioning
MKITEDQILKALSNVEDPDLKKDLVTLNMIKNIQIEGSHIRFDVELTTPACPMKDMIQNACVNAVKLLVDKSLTVEPNMTSSVTSNRSNETVLPHVKNIIAIASGKGGVGKSTITVNLARALARTGAKVGIMDADIYGPSLPTLMGLQNAKPESEGKKMLPIVSENIKVISIGFFVKDSQAVIWRGPMASSAIDQFTTDVIWGELDYLLLDLPPGTGDIHLTIAQKIPLTGAVVVTTPQEVALADSRKAVNMFLNPSINIPVLGVVENMSYFSPSDQPDKKYYLFGRGGGKALAEETKVPLLGEIPFTETIRQMSDAGQSIPATDELATVAYNHLAGEVARQMAMRNSMQQSSK